MHKELLKSKTAWTGLAAIVSAAGGFFTGTIDAATAMQTAITGLVAIFLRDAMVK